MADVEDVAMGSDDQLSSSPSGSLDSSSSGSDFEEVEASADDVALQGQLEASLADNPRQYDVHLQVRLSQSHPTTVQRGSR